MRFERRTEFPQRSQGGSGGGQHEVTVWLAGRQ